VWASSRGQLSGLPADAIIPSGGRHGLVLTCVIGSAGALLGGWAAPTLFRPHHPLNGIFNLRTWLTALATAAVLSPVNQLITTQSGQ
jgi:uncharacterized membrane protein YeaQ/YmgE (transglycosylase-associated protein family)